MKRILVTGGNKGIGRAIVSAILEQHNDTFVLLGSRSSERGDAARQELVADHPEWTARLQVIALDVSDAASVERAAASVAERFRPLYGIVNNAGVGFNADARTVLDVNALGIKRVCEALLPSLDREAGRIVNITSAAGPVFVAKCSPERQRFFCDPNTERDALSGFIDECMEIAGDAAAFADRGLADGNSYGLSKASANLYTMILAREHPHLRINACTPGYIATDLTQPMADKMGKTPAELGMKPPSEGTRSALHLLFGELGGNGWYYGSDAKRSPIDRYRAPGDPEYTGD